MQGSVKDMESINPLLENAIPKIYKKIKSIFQKDLNNEDIQTLNKFYLDFKTCEFFLREKSEIHDKKIFPDLFEDFSKKFNLNLSLDNFKKC